jgi:hypothetical protein
MKQSLDVVALTQLSKELPSNAKRNSIEGTSVVSYHCGIRSLFLSRGKGGGATP